LQPGLELYTLFKKHKYKASMKPGKPVLRTVQEIIGYSDVSTTMVYTYVLKVAVEGIVSPLDVLGFGA